jgi:hypothetical protein
VEGAIKLKHEVTVPITVFTLACGQKTFSKKKNKRVFSKKKEKST